MLLSACNSNPQLQQQENQNKVELDNAIIHAQSIGVPHLNVAANHQSGKSTNQYQCPNWPV